MDDIIGYRVYVPLVQDDGTIKWTTILVNAPADIRLSLSQLQDFANDLLGEFSFLPRWKIGSGGGDVGEVEIGSVVEGGFDSGIDIGGFL